MFTGNHVRLAITVKTANMRSHTNIVYKHEKKNNESVLWLTEIISKFIFLSACQF